MERTQLVKCGSGTLYVLSIYNVLHALHTFSFNFPYNHTRKDFLFPFTDKETELESEDLAQSYRASKWQRKEMKSGVLQKNLTAFIFTSRA